MFGNKTQPLNQKVAAKEQNLEIPARERSLPKPGTELSVTGPRRIPDGIGEFDKQLVLLTGDRSGSMEGQKLKELNAAMKDMIRELAAPANKDGFYVGVVSFGHDAKVALPFAKATAARAPQLKCEGGTDFNVALDVTTQTLNAAINGKLGQDYTLRKSHVMFLSDGQSRVSDEYIAALHAIADVTVVAYGDDADHATLARIATERWSRKFGPVVKVDRIMRKTIQNEETKEPFCGFQGACCA